MERNKITLYLGDWLYNVGIVGLINILEYANPGSVEYNELNSREVSFLIAELDNFQEKFFRYLIDTYEPILAWTKVISYKNEIERFERDDYKCFDEESLKRLNNYIEDLKKNLKKNSHIAAYELISDSYSVIETEKQIKKITLNKKEPIESKLDEIKNTIGKISEIITYYSNPEAKKYIAGKNVVYTIIKNAWNGVSMLNPQTKIKDIYEDYKEYFIEDIKADVEKKEKTAKYNCFTCGNPLENLNIEMGFLNGMGFDSTRKPSHVWNYYNDIAICPVCKLVYSCIPAGFMYVYDKGIFVNDNNSAKRIVSIARLLKMDILKDDSFNINTTFKSIITAIQEKENEVSKYELADIQVVRYEQEKYRFNILTKQILKVIYNSKEELNRIIKTGYKENNDYFRLYEQVVRTLFNNENLFLFIHKLLVYLISKSREEIYYSIDNVWAVIKINFNYLKGAGYMDDREVDVLKNYRGAGYHLREAYKNKHAENKLNGISYKLLNSLKTNNQGMFMDAILNSYLYTNKQVPSFFTDCLKEKELFKTIGYAFVSGLIDGEEIIRQEDKKEEN